MKSTTLSSVLFAAATLSMAWGMVHAQTQTQLQRVAVTGSGVSDMSLPPLSEVCPAYLAVLDEKLSVVAAREGREAVVKVSFKLSGDQPIDLRIQGGPLEYRKAVRHALHHFDCRPGMAHGGNYQLLVSFNAREVQEQAVSQSLSLAALEPKR